MVSISVNGIKAEFSEGQWISPDPELQGVLRALIVDKEGLLILMGKPNYVPNPEAAIATTLSVVLGGTVTHIDPQPYDPNVVY